MGFSLSKTSPVIVRREDKNLAGLFLRVSKEHPNSGVFFVSDDLDTAPFFLSYPALLEESRRILGGLSACDCREGSNVVLLLERPRDFIPAFWACVLGGYIPCALAPIRNDPSRWASHLAHVDTLLDHPALITTARMRDELHGIKAIDLDVLRTVSPQGATYQANLSDPAVLMLTSGSTGSAKAVELTHGNLLSSMAGKAESQELEARDVALNWIAFDHVAALLEVHMIAQYVGATQVHVEPATVLADPLMFLRLIDRYRVSLAFSPNFLLGQINAAIQSIKGESARKGLQNIDLSCLRYIVTGGEANVVETGRRFLELLAPHGLVDSALRPAFGMTETSAASVYSHEFPTCDATKEFASVGYPIKGLQTRIVDENAVMAEAGASGELQVRGPMVFSRYYHNEEATRAAFTSDGWFRTGDLGYVESGRLSLIGRSKDCIIVSGVNYFSHELEAALEALDGIVSSYVAAFPIRPRGVDTEQLVVAFATAFSKGDNARIYQLVVAIRNTTIMTWGFRPAVILPLPQRAFPKTSLGKIQRALMRKRFEEGEFAEYTATIVRIMSEQLGDYVPPNGEMEIAVGQMFCDILELEAGTLSAAASFFDLGGTSLDILKLTRKIAQQFGVPVAAIDVLQDPTVRGLAMRIAQAKGGERTEYDPVVPMQRTGSKTPLFCIHPGNGEVLIFVNLAKYFINDRPFYALRARGFNRGEECFSTFDELVETYLHAICKRQAHGPYALAGYSVGCPIVFEIAKRLESRGERVAFLGCIDEGPSVNWPPTDFVSSAVALSFVLGLATAESLEKLKAQVDEKSISNPCEHIFRSAPPERLRELDLDLLRFSSWAKVAQSNHTLVRSAHVTVGTVERMIVFCSSGWGQAQEWHDHLKEWDRFSRRPNKYIELPGNHMEIMDTKHVAGFQAVLRAEIDLALGDA